MTRPFTILTIGWVPEFAAMLLGAVTERTGIRFVHAVVGDSRRVPALQDAHAGADWVAIGLAPGERLPEADRDLVASLEGRGVPTARSMILGDQALRFRSEDEAFRYSTHMARRLDEVIREQAPDLVLGSFDGLHATLSLGVARHAAIPWVALTFSTIPEGRTSFTNGTTPDDVLPLGGPPTDAVRAEARDIIERFLNRNVAVMAYRAPRSVTDWFGHVGQQMGSLRRRLLQSTELGLDGYILPTSSERFRDSLRRTWNRLRFPGSGVIATPPERPYAFLPLHMAPEATVDTWAPMYQDQIGFANQLARAIPADHDFVIKPHFSDPDNYSREQLTALMKLPGVRVADPFASGRDFIEQAALVVGITGTSNLEAVFLGKPVLIFGNSPYQHLPGVARADRPDRLADQIRDLLAAPRPSRDEVVESYANYLARYLPGRINDWSRPVTDEDHDRIAGCFTALRDYVQSPGVRDAWYTRPPFAAADSSATPRLFDNRRNLR